MVWDTVGRLIGTEMTNRSNARQARANRDFQERMSNTSYQRAVKDMKTAGINPMLAAKVGGASTPAGAVAQVADYGQAYSEGRKVDLQRELNKSQVKATNEQANLYSAQAAKARAETITEMTRPDLNRAQTSSALSSAGQADQSIQESKQRVSTMLAQIENIKADTLVKSAEFGVKLSQEQVNQTIRDLNKADLVERQIAAEMWKSIDKNDGGEVTKFLFMMRQLLKGGR